MTIKKRLYTSFSFILAIIVFIIGIFYYVTLNLNEIHQLQNHRYEQLRRVERIKEYNSAFAWIVLDVIIDQDKDDIVRDRLNKAEELFKELYLSEDIVISNSETKEEKQNLVTIYSYLGTIETFILDELKQMSRDKAAKKEFYEFNERFKGISNATYHLIEKEIEFLQDRLAETEEETKGFIEKIKLELFALLLISFLLSFVISRRIISEIKTMLGKLNDGVLELLHDKHTHKIDIDKGTELSEIADNFNEYLEQKDDIIKSREELLRNISHELKTPITKGKFLLEKLKENKHDTIDDINDVFYDIEELTSKLLQREKLNYATLNITNFKVTTLILESLSKLSIDDESNIEIDIDEDFKIEGDIYYLTLAVKNLIDNAMKYSKEYPIIIKTEDKKIVIQNNADKLSNSFLYYLQPFTREPNQQLGHGLGLNIVNKILQLHDFSMEYEYIKPYNTFTVNFK